MLHQWILWITYWHGSNTLRGTSCFCDASRRWVQRTLTIVVQRLLLLLLLSVMTIIHQVVPLMAIISLSQTQGMTDFLVCGLVIYFHPLLVIDFIVIKPSKKPCSSALELLNDPSGDGSLVFASWCQVSLTISIHHEVKIVVSMVTQDMKAPSTDDILRTSRYCNNIFWRHCGATACDAVVVFAVCRCFCWNWSCIVSSSLMRWKETGLGLTISRLIFWRRVFGRHVATVLSSGNGLTFLLFVEMLQFHSILQVKIFVQWQMTRIVVTYGNWWSKFLSILSVGLVLALFCLVLLKEFWCCQQES